MLNRRAHIGTLLMVLGTLVLVVTGLVSFHKFNLNSDSLQKNFREITSDSLTNHRIYLLGIKEIFSEAISKNKDSFDFENDFKNSIIVLAKEKRVSGQDTNIYAELALGHFTLTSQNGKYNLLASSVSDKNSVEYNSIKYAYSLEVVFTKDKVLSVNTLSG